MTPCCSAIGRNRPIAVVHTASTAPPGVVDHAATLRCVYPVCHGWHSQGTRQTIHSNESQALGSEGRGTLTGSYLPIIKTVHTTIWAILAGCILAIPIFGWAEMYRHVLSLTGIVLMEILVLFFNGWQCPLTSVAARHTDDRRDNFDIYLPAWLARHNKIIFGSLLVVGEVIVILRWRDWIG